MVYITRIFCETEDWEIQATERGILKITNQISYVHGRENEWSRQGAKELQEYFAGKRTTFSVPLDVSGTPFQCAVWQLLREIPYGTSVCYSCVAERLGKPTAVRAVAQAIGKNPCLVMIPCHRVLGKDGSLTGFSAGLDLKKALLNLEGILYR